MKIDHIGYERLFSFGKYENEKIKFDVAISPGENSAKILGKLYLDVCNIEEVLQFYRYLQRQEFDKKSSVECIRADCERSIHKIADMKVRIDEITEAIKKGTADSDTRLRHACDRDSYQEERGNLEKRQHDLSETIQELQTIQKAGHELRERIKRGVFSIEGLDIKKAHYDFYRHE